MAIKRFSAALNKQATVAFVAAACILTLDLTMQLSMRTDYALRAIFTFVEHHGACADSDH